MKFLFFFSVLLLISKPAFAHWGHLGEFAGHSHWLGLGAVAVAGVIAGVIGLLNDKEEEDENDEDAVQEGETA